MSRIVDNPLRKAQSAQLFDVVFQNLLGCRRAKRVERNKNLFFPARQRFFFFDERAARFGIQFNNKAHRMFGGNGIQIGNGAHLYVRAFGKKA